jgi:hypothetical protein
MDAPDHQFSSGLEGVKAVRSLRNFNRATVNVLSKN